MVALPATLCFEGFATPSAAPPLPPRVNVPKAPAGSLAFGGPAALLSSFKRPARVQVDPRTNRLHTFLSRLRCPVKDLAADFVSAADENHLDWRLLPSISVIESGGGKACRNNNIFGWANGQKAFETVSSGIREVAFKLGRSPLYRNRNVEGKLHVYNPDETYADSVITVMQRISPAPAHPASALQDN